jgi:hypothetical protein
MLKTLTLAVALFLAGLTTPAEARRGGGLQEFLELVVPIDAPAGAPQQGLALCHLVERHTVVFFPLYYVSKGYVVSDAGCATDEYYPLTADGFTEMKALGLVPADLPDTPQLSFKQQATPYFTGGFVGLIALFAFIQRMGQRGSTAAPAYGTGRMTGIPDDPVLPDLDAFENMRWDHYSLMMVEVLSHIVHKGWVIDDAERQRIAAIARQFLGSDFHEARINRMVDSASSNLTSRRFQELAPELTPEQRENVLRAAILAAGDPETVPPATRSFVQGLASILSVPDTRFQQLITAPA